MRYLEKARPKLCEMMSSTASRCTALAPVAGLLSSAGTCIHYPSLAAGKLPLGPFAIHDSYPMPYLISSPCQNVSLSALSEWKNHCASFASGDDAGAPAWASANGVCYALGHGRRTSVVPFGQPRTDGSGVVIRIDGGVGGRTVAYRLVCNSSLPVTAGPTAAEEHTPGAYGYTIDWATPLACDAVVQSSGSSGNECVGTTTPTPNRDLLLYQESEVGALVCYNMATAAGTQGCAPHNVPPPSTYTSRAPTASLDTDQWCAAIASFGGKYATLVAKHVCGFAIWPTNASLDRGGGTTWRYTYGVTTDDEDVVRKLAESCAAVGVRLGLYYSVNANEYLNVGSPGKVRDSSTATGLQQVITQEEYDSIVAQQLTELWTQYGDLAEIWFDGGFAVPGLESTLLALLNRTQPHAVVFNGCGLSSNAVAWIGTESGHAPGPVWNPQSGCGSGGGSPSGTSFIPKEADLTLQAADTWFYQEGRGYVVLLPSTYPIFFANSSSSSAASSSSSSVIHEGTEASTR